MFDFVPVRSQAWKPTPFSLRWRPTPLSPAMLEQMFRPAFPSVSEILFAALLIALKSLGEQGE
jgi:hypothetical protein